MTDLSAKTAQTNPPPLAITLPLFGQHLIEASAGTGKTWTLTGIVLRLLLQEGYKCDQIIASTFTRSAAAEMRQRIRERLQDTEALLKECKKALALLKDKLLAQGNLDDNQNNRLFFSQSLSVTITDDIAKQYYDDFNAILAELLEKKDLTKKLGDPINQYLIDWIAKQEFGLPTLNMTKESTKEASDASVSQHLNKTADTPATTANANNAVNFFLALNRTSNALIQLDRLFVGTLDSLCQKWLQEFSADTGYQPNIQISNNVENIILAMIHDQLRAFRATVNTHEPEIFKLMYATNALPKAQEFLPAVDKALNFYRTPIKPFMPQPFDLEKIKTLLENIKQADSDALQPYADSTFRTQQGMVGNAKLNSRFPDGLSIQKQLHQQGILGLLQLSERQTEWLASVNDFVQTSNEGLDKGKGFKKGFLTERETFFSMPLIQLYAQLHHATQTLKQHIDDLNQYFHRFICNYVREHLPSVLEAQQMTTFSLQLDRLNTALASNQGESLVRYIRHQYPVALIDESQDINTEQALLIQRIYLPHSPPHNRPNHPANAKKTDLKPNKRQFLLLVGDPKQAIYGFRGGDVANYNQLKAQFTHPPQELNQNRRSSPAVINALNHWFGKPSEAQTIDSQDDQGEPRPEIDQPYFLGERIYYRYIQASREASDLWLHGTLGKNNIIQNASLDQSSGVYLLNIAYKQTLSATQETTDSQTQRTIDFSDVVAAQVLALLDPKQPTGYPDKKGNIRPLMLNHIGILADKNKQLDSIEQALQAHNITTTRVGSQSVFAGDMTQDLITLMQAMLYPYDVTRLRRLLMSHFFGLSLAEITKYYDPSEKDNQETQPPNSADQKDTKENNTVQNYTALSDIQQHITAAGKTWQKAGFLTAIQGFLNTEITLKGEKHNFWQRIAQYHHKNRQKSGERLLIDLRQLLDIISQINQGTSQEMGEHQLLEWLEQQQNEQPKEEWSMQQRLASDDAVQLMTIHNSKGLEFPIVFVVGLDKMIHYPKQNYKLFLHTSEEKHGLQHRMLSPVPYNFDKKHKTDTQIKPETYYQDLEILADYQEKLRLAYVGLTRCRDRLYIVAQANYANLTNVPLNQWLIGKNFENPERLNNIITPVDINSLSKYFDPNHKYQSKKQANTSAIDYPHWQDNIKMKGFIGWTNTSFTALARHLQQEKLDVAINQPDYLFENSPQDTRHTILNIEDAVKTTIENAVETGIENALEPELKTERGTKRGNDIGSYIHIQADSQANPSYDPQFDEWLDVLERLESTPNFDEFDLNELNLDAGNYDEHYLITEQQSQMLRFNFERGTNTGTFLHKILETLPPLPQLERDSRGNPTHDAFKTWTPLIDRAITTYQIAPEFLSDYNEQQLNQTDLAQMENMLPPPAPTQVKSVSPQHFALASWLYDIMQTPLLASQISLAQIPASQKIAELSFDMSLKQDFDLEKVNDLFKTIDITLNLNKSGQYMSYWRYLKGEIDLVYQAGEQGHERFFVVDYKSNYLGNQFDLYDKQAMEQAMNEHGYWLQAAIYQVALHRYLSLRLQDYNITKHLGVVEYVFLRGMSPNYLEQGRLVCEKLTPDFILKLDDILGNASVDDKLK